MKRVLVRSVLSALALAGCSGPHDVDSGGDPVQLVAASDGEIRVREDGLTLWVDAVARPAYSGTALQVTISGRTSSNLKAAFSSVPDDAFGKATVVGPRSFTVVLQDGHEINTLLSGLPIRVQLDLSNGRTYTARIGLAPRFTAQSGASAIGLDAAIRPVYFQEGASALRYRGTATAMSPSLTVTASGGAVPSSAALGGGRFRLDWQYAGLAQLFDSTSDRVTLTAAVAGASVSRSAAIEVAVDGVELTAADPSTRWPDPQCAKTVYDCIHAQPAGTRDFAACGSYREVARCMIADACDVVPAPVLPFALTGTDATALSAAVKSAHDLCPRTGGSWCSVGPAATFTYARCVAMSPTLAQVGAAALAETDHGGSFDPRYGTEQTRAQLLTMQTFKTGLLTAIDRFAGDTDVRALQFESEEPCHNCHQFAHKFVLFYPRTRVVVVIDGSYGYDS